jgi:DNA-binding response OmpR family regulator
MRHKILAIGRDIVTGWVDKAMKPQGFEVVRLFELPETVNIIKQDGYDMVVLDSGLPEVDNICFKVSWLCRLRIAIVSSDMDYDMKLLAPLGADAFISINSQPFDLVKDIETLISFGPPKMDSARVLVVEDDHHIREAIRLSFRIFWPESELFFADEGQTGINIIKNKAIDMVLLDLGLPDISGFEVLAWIRSFSRAPVIVLTAARDQDNVIRAINAGANDYLIKPFKQMELMPRIHKYIREHALSI